MKASDLLLYKKAKLESDPFDTHQKRIARKTLSLSIPGAKILGGMTHAEAFQIIFREPLRERLTYLLETYPDATPESVCCELDMYGWSGADAWRELLNSIKP